MSSFCADPQAHGRAGMWYTRGATPMCGACSRVTPTDPPAPKKRRKPRHKRKKPVGRMAGFVGTASAIWTDAANLEQET